MKKILIIVVVIFVLFDLTACDNNKDNTNTNNKVSAVKYSNYLINATDVYSDNNYNSDNNNSYPSKYDLRDLGVVTPVKNQNPWSSCWGFAAISAAETSILNDFGLTYEDTLLDLSELQLIWFSKTHITDENDVQYGEGIYVEGNENPLSYGGLVYTATSIFSSGTGVINEEVLPYKGKNGNTDGSIYNYSANDDWTVDEQYRNYAGFELIESNILPNPSIKDENNIYIGYNEYGTNCIKEELLKGRAVSICYHADTYLPNTSNEPKYINTNNNKWTHYTYDNSNYNHAVTIVGYDDNISRYDFLDHTNENGAPCLPEGDGAWICKNSWGAETEEFPNYGKWGIKNNEGLSTGYFYLSYYDHSLYAPESFVFQAIHKENDFIIEQYDLLQSKDQECWYSQSDMKMANIFISDYDESMYAISCETSTNNCNVNYKVYLLSDNYDNPEDGLLIYENNVNYNYAGYHRLELNTPIIIKPFQTYSIVISQQFQLNDNNYYGVFVDRQNSIDCAQNVSSSSNDENNNSALIYGIGIVNSNESYIYIGDVGGWCDWHDVVEVFKITPTLKNDTFDNFPIKAYLNFN